MILDPSKVHRVKVRVVLLLLLLTYLLMPPFFHPTENLKYRPRCICPRSNTKDRCRRWWRWLARIIHSTKFKDGHHPCEVEIGYANDWAGFKPSSVTHARKKEMWYKCDWDYYNRTSFLKGTSAIGKSSLLLNQWDAGGVLVNYLNCLSNTTISSLRDIFNVTITRKIAQ